MPDNQNHIFSVVTVKCIVLSKVLTCSPIAGLCLTIHDFNTGLLVVLKSSAKNETLHIFYNVTPGVCVCDRAPGHGVLPKYSQIESMYNCLMR